MSEQSLRLLRALLAEKGAGARPQDLAASFGVSDRSVRTYVRQANEELFGVASIEKRRGGAYELQVTDGAAFETWVAVESRRLADGAPATPEARVAYLVNDLLNRSGWVTLDDLSAVLFVSRTAITADLRHVEAQLARFGLALERRPHYGIRVTGSEMGRRLALANAVLRGGRTQADDALPPLDELAACVDGAVAREGMQINSAAYQNLLVHLSVAVRRIREGAYIPLETLDLEPLRGGCEYRAATRMAAAIQTRFNVEFPEGEVLYIALHLAGKQSLYGAGDAANAARADGCTSLANPQTGDAPGAPVISDEVWDVVARMIDLVWRAYRFDFRRDLELRMNLARHIVPLSVRLRYRMLIDNPLLTDTKARFPLAYSMAQDACCVLAEHYGTEPSDDEVGFIALSFALALERQKTGLPKKRILVVCASGQGSARLLEWRYRQEFGAYINDVVTCDVAHVTAQDFTDIDYVFTTVPLGVALPVPVREVKFFLDDADVLTLRELLAGAPAALSLDRFFDRRLFVGDLQADTKEEAIDALCDLVKAYRDVDSSFRDLVYRREAAAPTSFGNNVAMPHPLEPVSDQTFVAVGLLKHPIAWNEWASAQAVFLVCVSREWNDGLRDFYEATTRVLTDKDKIALLLEKRSWEALMELLAGE